MDTEGGGRERGTGLDRDGYRLSKEGNRRRGLQSGGSDSKMKGAKASWEASGVEIKERNQLETWTHLPSKITDCE